VAEAKLRAERNAKIDAVRIGIALHAKRGPVICVLNG
jgi:hypothetical protein